MSLASVVCPRGDLPAYDTGCDLATEAVNASHAGEVDRVIAPLVGWITGSVIGRKVGQRHGQRLADEAAWRIAEQLAQQPAGAHSPATRTAVEG